MTDHYDEESPAELLEVQERRLEEVIAETTALALGLSLITDLLVAKGHIEPALLQSETMRLLSTMAVEASGPQAAYVRQTHAALSTLLLDGGRPERRFGVTVQ